MNLMQTMESYRAIVAGDLDRSIGMGMSGVNLDLVKKILAAKSKDTPEANAIIAKTKEAIVEIFTYGDPAIDGRTPY